MNSKSMLAGLMAVASGLMGQHPLIHVPRDMNANHKVDQKKKNKRKQERASRRANRN